MKKALYIFGILCFGFLSCSNGLNDAFNVKSGLSSLMVYVPAGSFQRDGTAGNISTVSAFYMGKYEVTRAQFYNVTGYDPSNTNTSPTLDCPAQAVNWYDDIVFCNRLSIREGLTPVYTISGSTNPDDWGPVPTVASTVWDAAICNMNADGYRLPTEMEWRWAAMGATSDARSGDIVSGVNTGWNTKGYSGSLESGTLISNISDYAWYNGNSGITTHPVGTKLPNELGLYDMSGNVYERCWDGYIAGHSSVPAGSLTNYTGDNSTAYRVMLGGTWAEDYQPLRPASGPLGDYPPGPQYPTAGLRVVRSAGTGYIPRTGLVGEWLFDGNANDTSGSSNDGSASGATLTSSGYNGQGYSFTSSNYISIPDANILDVGYITVSFYIYPTSRGKIIMKDDENGGATPGTYQIEINNANKLDFSCFTGSGRNIVNVVGDAIAMNQWYHVACTFNGSMLRIYLNGSLYSEASSGLITSLQHTTMNTYIGYCPGGSPNFTGTIDSVRIYNRALSAAEVSLLYNE